MHIALAFLLAGTAAAPMGPLTIHPENPRYFANPAGEMVYLTGSHTWAAIQERGVEGETPDFDYPAFLKHLKSLNHNFIRLWAWEQATWMQFESRERKIRYKPTLYLRTGPGTALDGQPKFDLARLNPEYYQRWRERVALARDMGFYVGVMLFQGFSIEQKGTAGVDEAKGNPWDGHPYNAANNINGVDGDLNGDGEGEETHTLANPVVTRLQEAHVKRQIENLNEFGNIVWEISNESHGGSTEWQYHMVRFIRETEAAMPARHPVWMSFQWGEGENRGTLDDLINGPADAISPGGSGGYRENPPPADGAKVSIADTDHINPWGTEPEWVWKAFLRGHNPIVMDYYRDVRIGSPPQPNEKQQALREAAGITRIFANRIALERMIPTPDAASGGYCLADGWNEYLAYWPDAGEGLWIEPKKGEYRLELHNPQTGALHSARTVRAQEGEAIPIPPLEDLDGGVLAYLKRTDD